MDENYHIELLFRRFRSNRSSSLTDGAVAADNQEEKIINEVTLEQILGLLTTEEQLILKARFEVNGKNQMGLDYVMLHEVLHNIGVGCLGLPTTMSEINVQVIASLFDPSYKPDPKEQAKRFEDIDWHDRPADGVFQGDLFIYDTNTGNFTCK